MLGEKGTNTCPRDFVLKILLETLLVNLEGRVVHRGRALDKWKGYIREIDG